MNIEVASVYGASKFEQKVTEAPASVSIVTAEDIQKYGYRTLTEILRSVRGFYSTYDRNYHYLGVRGFACPGDYNTRVLLLINGHRVNDNVYDQAVIGTDFPIDVDLIERVEIIRGPSSSLYGTSAFFCSNKCNYKTRWRCKCVRDFWRTGIRVPKSMHKIPSSKMVGPSASRLHNVSSCR